MIAVADTVKESSAAAIDELHHLGLRVAMLTGDNQQDRRSDWQASRHGCPR